MRENSGEFTQHWRIVLGGFVGIAAGFASLYFYTAGLFIKPLSAEFGWTRSEASLGSLSIMIGNIIALPIAGRLIDRFGEIRVALISGLSLSAAFALLGKFTGGLTSYVLLVLLLTIASAGSNAIGYNRIIVRHFVVRRGAALGLALTGTAVGAAAVPPFLVPYIADHGWRSAYYVLAAMTAILTVCALLLLRRAGDKVITQASRGEDQTSWRAICSHSAFAPISAMIFLSSTAVLGSTMHMMPMLTDGGIDLIRAGTITSTLGIAVIAGRVIAGQMLDRWDAGWVTWLLLTLSAMGAFLLWSGAEEFVTPGAILIGFGVGTEGDLLAYLLGRRFPVKSFGSVYGTIFAVHALGGGLGGLLAGAVFDWTGSYSAWLLFAGVALAVAGLIALVTERGYKPALNPAAREPMPQAAS